MRLAPGSLTLDDLRELRLDRTRVELADDALTAVRRSADIVERAAEGDEPIYGINTGFGKLASTRIDRDALADLQVNLIRSHAAGVGSPLPAPVVRLTLALKIASLGRGHSGVRESVLDTLVRSYNAGLVPLIPAQGSSERPEISRRSLI